MWGLSVKFTFNISIALKNLIKAGRTGGNHLLLLYPLKSTTEIGTISQKFGWSNYNEIYNKYIYMNKTKNLT